MIWDQANHAFRNNSWKKFKGSMDLVLLPCALECIHPGLENEKV